MLTRGRFARAVYVDGVAGDLSFPDAAVVAVDVPIGFGPREADAAARRFLRGRAPTVFPTPPRGLLERPFTPGLGISRQSHALGPRTLHVTALASRDARVYEVHPEVSFQALAGHPLAASKKTAAGARERQALLAAAGIDVPSGLGLPRNVAADDVLDAAAAAWSAGRIARGEASRLPADVDERDETGRLIAIWY